MKSKRIFSDSQMECFSELYFILAGIKLRELREAQNVAKGVLLPKAREPPAECNTDPLPESSQRKGGSFP